MFFYLPGDTPKAGCKHRQIKMVTPSAYTGFNNKPGGMRAFSDRSSPRSEKINFLCALCVSVVNSMLASGNNLMHSVILLEIIKQVLESGEDVLVSGFGKFQVKYKRKRRGRNPVTNEDLILPPRRVVTFKCSGKLRDRINK